MLVKKECARLPVTVGTELTQAAHLDCSVCCTPFELLQVSLEEKLKNGNDFQGYKGEVSIVEEGRL